MFGKFGLKTGLSISSHFLGNLQAIQQYLGKKTLFLRIKVHPKK